jgi:BASS family bile acid:Na+ symporter
MEQSLLSTVFLPVALAIIMLGMGLSLTIRDFQRITLYPKAVFTGLFCQLILLPLVAWIIASGMDLDPALSVGIMVLSLCPGGATSNLITHLAKGDTALSITLTAITSTITVFTLPYLINLSSEYFIGSGQYVELPILKTMAQILLVTLLPVAIGMILNHYFPAFAASADRTVRIASVVFIVLVIVGIAIKERAHIVDFFVQSGLAGLLLNVFSMAMGFLVAKLARLTPFQQATVTIETGIQNGTLAIAITAGIIGNAAMAIPAATYSLIMFFTAALLVPIFARYFASIR